MKQKTIYNLTVHTTMITRKKTDGFRPPSHLSYLFSNVHYACNFLNNKLLREILKTQEKMPETTIRRRLSQRNVFSKTLKIQREFADNEVDEIIHVFINPVIINPVETEKELEKIFSDSFIFYNKE